MTESILDRGPLPPEALCYRVAGTTDYEWFDKSGGITTELYGRCLKLLGQNFTNFHEILDWGCGCGRVLRWLPKLAPAARIFGSDIDEAAIKWIDKSDPRFTVRVNGGLPPLDFPGQKFDLVLSYSVFTHLDETYQDAWLQELYDKTNPNATLLLTISSDNMWEFTMRTSDHPKLEELNALRQKLDENGFVFWNGDGWEQHFPDFYHTTFHSHEYIRRHWSKWFDVKHIQQGTDSMPQEVVILKRR